MTKNTDFEMEFTNEDERTEMRVYRVQTGMEFTIRGEHYLVMEVDAECDKITCARDGQLDDEFIECFGIQEVYHQLPEDARILMVGQDDDTDFRVGNHLYRIEYSMTFSIDGANHYVTDVNAQRDYIETARDDDTYAYFGIADLIQHLPDSAHIASV
jgi:hypothetical protein